MPKMQRKIGSRHKCIDKYDASGSHPKGGLEVFRTIYYFPLKIVLSPPLTLGS